MIQLKQKDKKGDNMLDTIKLIINEKEYEYSSGITIEEVSKDFSKE